METDWKNFPCGLNRRNAEHPDWDPALVSPIPEFWDLYWDWTQDWEDPAGAVIWDSNLGFGGSGNPLNEDCVEEGPFAGFEVSYRAGDFIPHCLARSFSSDNGTGKFSG
ncbi:hypothetical protein F66182_15226, partial [Fusarium sp. NRRL 66182]